MYLKGHAVDRAKLVGDAHFAALAIEHGLKLCSTDGDSPGSRSSSGKTQCAGDQQMVPS
jgi:hypothetical protein